MRLIGIMIAAFLLTVQVIEANSKMSQFQLYTKCRGVHLTIEGLPERADRINLTWKQVLQTVKGRLKAARLYVPRSPVIGANEDIHPVLYVHINISRTAFSLGIELRKVVSDDYSGESEYATTWRIGIIGIHGHRNQFILRMVDKYTDIFIKEWTKVNKPGCHEEKAASPEQGPTKPPVRIR